MCTTQGYCCTVFFFKRASKPAVLRPAYLALASAPLYFAMGVIYQVQQYATARHHF